jgi:hypothetical protein
LHKRTAFFFFGESASRALTQSHGAQCLEANLSASKTPSEIQGEFLIRAARKVMGTRPQSSPEKTAPYDEVGAFTNLNFIVVG